jgi:hypothetical protein
VVSNGREYAEVQLLITNDSDIDFDDLDIGFTVPSLGVVGIEQVGKYPLPDVSFVKGPGQAPEAVLTGGGTIQHMEMVGDVNGLYRVMVGRLPRKGGYLRLSMAVADLTPLLKLLGDAARKKKEGGPKETLTAFREFGERPKPATAIVRGRYRTVLRTRTVSLTIPMQAR